MHRGVDTPQAVRTGGTKERLSLLCGRINAILAGESIVQHWGLAGRSMTMDALLTQCHLA